MCPSVGSVIADQMVTTPVLKVIEASLPFYSGRCVYMMNLDHATVHKVTVNSLQLAPTSRMHMVVCAPIQSVEME